MSSELLQGLWTGLWQGSLIALVVLVLSKYTRVPVKVRYWLWWLVCLKFLAAVVINPIELQLLRPEEPAARPIASVLERVEPPPFTTGVEITTPIGSATAPGFEWSWETALLAIWMIGVAVSAFSSLGSVYKLRRILRNATDLSESEIAGEARRIGAEMGLARIPRIVQSAEISSPLVAGLFRPTVVLPQGFEEMERSEIHLALAHELAHIKNHDLWMGVVPTVAQTLFFFLPTAWLAHREWVTEREAACDRDALDHTGAPVAVYGNLLLRLVTRDSQNVPAAVGATASYHTLKRRLMLMKTFRKPERPYRLGAGLIAIALIACMPWAVTAQTSDSKNLLRNSSLAENADGWVQGAAVDGVTYSRSKSVSRTGEGSLLINKNADKFFPLAQWSQPFKHDGKSEYIKVGAWVRAKRMTKAVIDVQFVRDTPDGTKETLKHEWSSFIGAKDEGQAPADHDWKEYSGVVQIPAGTQDIIVALQVYGPGSIWFDDISAVYTEKPAEKPVDASAPNAVVNGDFEKGLDSWSPGTLPPNSSVPDIVIEPDKNVKHGGSSSLFMTRTGQRFFPVKMITQGIQMPSPRPTKVRVTAWVKAENVRKATIALWFDDFTEFATYVGEANEGDKPANHDWKEYSQTFNVRPGTRTMMVGVQMYGPGKVWFDDIKVTFE